ncbi:MAG: hypothetical protein U5L96_08035 [Owenweeksia sp.]|nr:hypothetical protein [Owenweeksia sp.]
MENSNDHDNSTAIAANTTYMLIYVYDGGSGRWDAYLNGSLAMSDGSVPGSLPSHVGGIGIGVIENDTQFDGNDDVANGEEFEGYIMEMGYYNNKALSAAERQAIFSYLAIKYGITYDDDYLSAGSTTIWDNSANSGYNNDIAGMGRNDDSELDQKQGITANSDGMVSMGLGSVAI